MFLRGLIVSLEEAKQVLAPSSPRMFTGAVIVCDTFAHSALLHLQSILPHAAPLVLAHDPPAIYVRMLLALGVPCVPKTASEAQIAAAVVALGPGSNTPGESCQPTISAVTPLTARQTDVLRLVAQGAQYAAVGHALGISAETVRKHVAEICRRLGVKKRQALLGLRVPAPYA